jgi:hypothetical protein
VTTLPQRAVCFNNERRSTCYPTRSLPISHCCSRFRQGTAHARAHRRLVSVVACPCAGAAVRPSGAW